MKIKKNDYCPVRKCTYTKCPSRVTVVNETDSHLFPLVLNSIKKYKYHLNVYN